MSTAPMERMLVECQVVRWLLRSLRRYRHKLPPGKRDIAGLKYMQPHFATFANGYTGLLTQPCMCVTFAQRMRDRWPGFSEYLIEQAQHGV